MGYAPKNESFFHTYLSWALFNVPMNVSTFLSCLHRSCRRSASSWQIRDSRKWALAATDTEKPVFSCHLKIDKTKDLKTDGCLMQVKSIANAPLHSN